MPRNSRRVVLASIAACGVVTQAPDAEAHERYASAGQRPLPLERPVSLIIPDADTPVARKAAAASVIDEDMTVDSELKRRVLGALPWLGTAGFAELGRPVLRTGYATAGLKSRQHSRLIMSCTGNRYCATKIPLIRELADQRNVKVGRFPVCQNEKHA